MQLKDCGIKGNLAHATTPHVTKDRLFEYWSEVTITVARGCKTETGWSIGPARLFLVRVRNAENLTLVKRRRRRRDFLPFELYFMQSRCLALYVDTTPNLRKIYVSELIHNTYLVRVSFCIFRQRPKMDSVKLWVETEAYSGLACCFD